MCSAFCCCWDCFLGIAMLFDRVGDDWSDELAEDRFDMLEGAAEEVAGESRGASQSFWAPLLDERLEPVCGDAIDIEAGEEEADDGERIALCRRACIRDTKESS